MHSFDEAFEEYMHLQNLIYENIRHLRSLEMQRAKLGLRAEPHILTSIEDLRLELRELYGKNKLLRELLEVFIEFDRKAVLMGLITDSYNKSISNLPKNEDGKYILDYGLVVEMGFKELADEYKGWTEIYEEASENFKKARIELAKMVDEYREL